LALNREYEYKQCTDEVNLKKKKKRSPEIKHKSNTKRRGKKYQVDILENNKRKMGKAYLP
jgi:hypothetical protein